MHRNKITRGNASQFFVAGELCRRGYSAVVTLGNTPNTDILCSNISGTKFVHIQVKTFVPSSKTCSVGIKAEKEYQRNFFWVLAGIPLPDSNANFCYYIIPSADMSMHIKKSFNAWLSEPGAKGNKHNYNTVRTVHIPPSRCKYDVEWDTEVYRDKWVLIEDCLKDD
jgi:hypothetical protein